MKQVIKPLVYLRYWDHAADNAQDVKPIICEVFGILKCEDDLCYTVVSWIANYNLDDYNSDGYAIIKSAVVEFRIINLEEDRNANSDEKRRIRSKKTAEEDNKDGIRKE